MNKSLFLLVALTWVVGARAQQGASLTDNDYAHAETLLGYGTESFIDNAPGPAQLDVGRSLLVPRADGAGSEFILVNPAKGVQGACIRL